MALRPTLFDVWVHRAIDGHRVVAFFERVDAAEVLAIKYEQQCLPGEISTWLVLPSPRLWDAVASPDHAPEESR